MQKPEATTQKWGSLSWCASKAMGNSPNLTFGRVVIKKGQNNPRHAHPNCDEVLYLLSGALQHSLGDKVESLAAGDTIVIPAGVPHNASAIGERAADMIVAYSSGERQFELEKQKETV